jgi:hypothetical protein
MRWPFPKRVRRFRDALRIPKARLPLLRFTGDLAIANSHPGKIDGASRIRARRCEDAQRVARTPPSSRASLAACACVAANLRPD